MNGSMGNMAFGAPEKPASENVLNLRTVHRMLPLVKRIVGDIVACQNILDQTLPEQNRLERQRRSLAWPERQRRYQLQEQLGKLSGELQAAMAELHDLGVVLLDLHQGRVGFPTLVNNRRAYFSWRNGEQDLSSWHFAEELACRPIPAAWLSEINGKN